jgi:hypothetical protein
VRDGAQGIAIDHVDHAIGHAETVDGQRREQGGRRDGHPPSLAPRRAVEPGVERPHEVGIAHLEAGVADAPTAGQQVERELHRFEMGMVGDPLEVRGTLVRRLLNPFYDRLTLELVIDEGSIDVGVAHERVRQRDRVLHRELRPRADGEVRGVRRVPEEHDVAVVPAPIAHPQKVEPDRAVGQQVVPVEVVGEEAFAEGDALALAHRVQPRPPPGRLRALDDERAGVLVERIRMHLEQAVLGLAKDEPERVEHKVRAEPHVLAALRLHDAAENIGIAAAEHAIHAVGGHHEVARDRRRIVDLHAKLELDAQLLAAALQDGEQLLAGDRREGVASRAQ